MEVVAHPSLTPTSQHQGTAAGNEEAMAPAPHADIPVSTQDQPKIGVPMGLVQWQDMKGAK